MDRPGRKHVWLLLAAVLPGLFMKGEHDDVTVTVRAALDLLGLIRDEPEAALVSYMLADDAFDV